MATDAVLITTPRSSPFRFVNMHDCCALTQHRKSADEVDLDDEVKFRDINAPSRPTVREATPIPAQFTLI